MTEHECVGCGITWLDNGPLIVFCFKCAEELV